jgi:hypothetical protein
MSDSKQADGLARMRARFADEHVSKLPKGTKTQNQCDAKDKVNCKVCGGWHHPRVVHLDYVGHAAITHRLLDADPMWSWEPLAFDSEGLPRFDRSGGLWIKLTICGVTRLGYGHAAAKEHMDPGAREKEVIGDALRNAAMRFGAALELWHKGELILEEEAVKAEKEALVASVSQRTTDDLAASFAQAISDGTCGASPEDEAMALLAAFDAAQTIEAVDAANAAVEKAWPRVKGVRGITESVVAMRKNARKRIKDSAV